MRAAQRRARSCGKHGCASSFGRVSASLPKVSETSFFESARPLEPAARVQALRCWVASAFSSCLAGRSCWTLRSASPSLRFNRRSCTHPSSSVLQHALSGVAFAGGGRLPQRRDRLQPWPEQGAVQGVPDRTAAPDRLSPLARQSDDERLVWHGRPDRGRSEGAQSAPFHGL